jgi:tripartite ATP-independent transporter DctM subunit
MPPLAVGAAALLGAPVFVAMGGIALVLFFADATPVSAVSAEVYRLIASPTLPAIPLLTAAGYVLAESGASSRLVRFFRALFGWMPGGMAVMVAAVCALFTTFTGGSGITIIALGGLVYPILREDGYPEGFSLGLVTAAGSLGLLFPPSLPVVLYSVVASSGQGQGVAAESLYLAGLVPGLLLVVLVCLYGIHVGRKIRPRRHQAFAWREVGQAAWAAKWELLLPVFVIGLFASGVASMVETAAAACAYAVVVECFITRDLSLRRQLPGVLLRASALMGAVLLLLSVAMGLTGYLVQAQIPDQLLAWVQLHIHSQTVFLLALNVILLVLGSVLEIYSAIIVLAPLIAPTGLAFGVDPVHLGVIFLANLELGFLFPPVGLNLFLSSSRFGKPLPQLYRHVLPFLVILGVGVLLITYLPQLSLGVLKLLGK